MRVNELGGFTWTSPIVWATVNTTSRAVGSPCQVWRRRTFWEPTMISLHPSFSRD